MEAFGVQRHDCMELLQRLGFQYDETVSLLLAAAALKKTLTIGRLSRRSGRYPTRRLLTSGCRPTVTVHGSSWRMLGSSWWL